VALTHHRDKADDFYHKQFDKKRRASQEKCVSTPAGERNAADHTRSGLLERASECKPNDSIPSDSIN
jgi:hypothetical protein